jgi:hypothetical protein
MMYIESPSIYDAGLKPGKSLFLAGGITGCPDWQHTITNQLLDTDLVVLNPRRANFPIDDPSAAEVQIKWEHEHLRRATAISFWFPCETLNPIVLYELGAWSMTCKRIFVGVHEKYERRRDVEIQTKLARPDVHIVYCLSDLADRIKEWANEPVRAGAQHLD